MWWAFASQYPQNSYIEAGDQMKILATLKAPIEEQEARAEAQQGWQGIVANGVRYKARLEAAGGRTYILRSISYDRSDILVCFQAVRRDFDGSWILVWKVLKEFETPKLIRAPAASCLPRRAESLGSTRSARL